MSAFADSSFLLALYRDEQDQSVVADRIMTRLRQPLLISSLVLLECRQAVRLQAFRFSRHRDQGYASQEADAILFALESNIAQGGIRIAAIDWPQVHARAEKLSARHTLVEGIRLLDLVHIAAALTCDAREFLTFDLTQKKVARLEGLRVRP